jgi:phosphohistidine phosphatase SixA
MESEELVVIIVRHAERLRLTEEKTASLTERGKKSVKALAAFIKDKGLTVEAAICAPTGPARETAEGLTRIASSEYENDLKPADFVELWDSKRVVQAMIFVGHEPKVSRLVSALTGRECRWLNPGEGVCVKGTRDDFQQKHARVEWASRQIDESKLLKDKIQSKVAVSTFLAGFFIAALVELVKDPDKFVPAPEHPLQAYMRIVSAIGFTLALGLLLAAVYVYDQLSMPRAFWRPMPEERKPRPGSGEFAHDFWLNGALYAYMLRTWKRIFTPGLCCGVIGFLALLAPNYDKPLGQVLIAGSVMAIALSIIMRYWGRSALGID